MKRLQRARELGAYEEWQRRTDKPMLIISVLFLLVILVPVVFTSLPLSVRNTLTVIETILWIVFVVDYLVRFLLAPKRWRFFWTHIPELLVISVPVLRPLRSLQVLRLLRLGGLGTVANRLAQRSLHGHAVLLVSAITLILVLTVAGIALIFERGNPHATITSYPEALWWALSTVTTVGYGDVYPVTSGGRLAGLFLMLAGIALAGIITAAVAAWFVQSVVKQADEVEKEKNAADASMRQATVLQRLDALEARLAQVDAGVKRILALLGASRPVSQDKIDLDYAVQTRSEDWSTQPASETEPGKKALGGLGGNVFGFGKMRRAEKEARAEAQAAAEIRSTVADLIPCPLGASGRAARHPRWNHPACCRWSGPPGPRLGRDRGPPQQALELCGVHDHVSTRLDRHQPPG